jgi:hypothetical protein
MMVEIIHLLSAEGWERRIPNNPNNTIPSEKICVDWGIAALQNTSGRLSDDFKGCIE